VKALILVAVSASLAHAEAPCITAFRTAQRVTIDGNAVKFCDDEGPKKQQCFARDLATGATTSTKVTDAVDAPDGPTLSIDGKKAKVCTAAGACKKLTPKARVDEGLGMHGMARGKLAVLINMDRIETFDVKSGKRLAGFSAGKGDCTNVAVLDGDVLYVHNQFCGDDEKGTHWFASAKGKKIADVPVHVVEPAILDTALAFVAFTGDEVIVQDWKSGKVTRRIALGKPSSESWPAIEGDAKRLVVVYGGDRRGDVAVIDLATEKVTTHAAKRCD
jgi:hypothetical protein